MNELTIFTRYPVAGRAKTRMIPELGPAGAARLQRGMTGFTVLHVRGLRHDEARVRVLFEGGSVRKMRRWLGPDLVYARQPEGDLGVRLGATFADIFARGAATGVIIGSDCPWFTAGLLREAYSALTQHDLVLGPAADGGYYLVGLRRPAPELFMGITWGTETVLRDTLRAAEKLALSIRRLPPLVDVDRPEDLDTWRTAAHIPGTGASGVAVPPGEDSAAALNAGVLSTHAARLLFPAQGVGLPDRAARVLEQALLSSGTVAAALHPDRRSRTWAICSGRCRAPVSALCVRRGAFLEVGGFANQTARFREDLLRRLRLVGHVAHLTM